MRKPGLAGSCWPTPIQEDVLRAAVLDPEAAALAWRRIRPRLLLDDLWDGEVYRLLPQVQAKLRLAGVADPDLARMKGLHRHTWYLNQQLLFRVQPWLDRLADAHIEVLLLKGAPLAWGWYADPGLRPMADIDILVPPGDAGRALDLLASGGFRDVGNKSRTTLFALHHGSGMVHEDGASIDVHWNLGAPFLLPGDGTVRNTSAGPIPPGTASMAAFWAHARPMAIAGRDARSLDATDLVLHVLVHGVWAGSGSAVRWVADLAAILAADPGQSDPVDWNRLIRRARERRVTLAVGNALRYALDTFDLPIPPHVPHQLLAEAIPLRTRLAFTAMAVDLDYSPTTFGGLPHLRAYWAYTNRPWNDAERVARLPTFLADLWDEPSALAVPVGAVRRAITRFAGRGRAVGPPIPAYVSEGRPAPLPPSTVSVVVPAYRRPDHLRRCLRALLDQHAPAEQIVVVHRTDDPEVAAVVREFADNPSISSVTVDRPALARAIHAGASAAIGSIVAFTDDDARPHPSWVATIRRRFEPLRVGAVGGRDVLVADNPPAYPVGRVGLVRWFGRVDGNHTLGTGGPRNVEHLKGVNMAYRADVLRIPANLRGQGAEVYNELAMGLHVHAAHCDVVYDPELLVAHDLGPRFDDDCREGPDPQARADAVFNQSFILFSMLPPWRRAVRLGYVLAWGDRGNGGVVCCAGLAARGDTDLRGLWLLYTRAHLQAWRAARHDPLRLVAPGQPFDAPRRRPDQRAR